MEFEIREMSDDEVEDVIHLEYDILGYSAFAQLSMTDYKKKVLVAVNNNEIVGVAVLYWNDEMFCLGSVAVKEEWRGRGIGKSLIRKAAEMASQLGYNSIMLEVNTANSIAVEIYRRVGFRIAEIIKHYYGIGKHAYRMMLQVQGS